ncbi:hypothetical protein C0Q91_24785 [Streptomyces albidoflavus]|uniref:Integral membrane protein n=1 Tax=Streptomyces albidoflavus TaxID=1886 RepID=A0AB37X732_9ACTN|nr:hypothetical protein C0Q91_24785 [Streptomyces albidoflavus]
MGHRFFAGRASLAGRARWPQAPAGLVWPQAPAGLMGVVFGARAVGLCGHRWPQSPAGLEFGWAWTVASTVAAAGGSGRGWAGLRARQGRVFAGFRPNRGYLARLQK